MRTYHHTIHFLRTYGIKHAFMYRAFIMIFFWSIFDGILTYILPLLISEHGFSKSDMGMILGSSSFAGAVFDIVVSKYLKTPHYRKLYASVFILSFSFLGILYFASTVWIFLLAMAVWGIYWDLFHFANFDFISRTTPEKEHSSSFGIQGIFHSLGILIAPIIAGLLIETTIDSKPFIVSGWMLFLSIIVYIGLWIQSKKSEEIAAKPVQRSTDWKHEYKIWLMITKQLAPVLVLTFLIYITDAFFWTIGPLIAEHGEFGKFGGFLLAAYSFPSLIIGWFVGTISNRFGKKRTAVYSFLIGSCVLSLFMFVKEPISMIVLVSIASSCIGLSFPALNGAYADYIFETQIYEKEIQGIVDFFYNIGWMIGPMLAGILAQIFGNAESFSILAIFCAGVSIILVLKMPRKIRLKVPAPRGCGI